METSFSGQGDARTPHGAFDLAISGQTPSARFSILLTFRSFEEAASRAVLSRAKGSRMVCFRRIPRFRNGAEIEPLSSLMAAAALTITLALTWCFRVTRRHKRAEGSPIHNFAR
jgi:hypothetical protein